MELLVLGSCGVKQQWRHEVQKQPGLSSQQVGSPPFVASASGTQHGLSSQQVGSPPFVASASETQPGLSSQQVGSPPFDASASKTPIKVSSAAFPQVPSEESAWIAETDELKHRFIKKLAGKERMLRRDLSNTKSAEEVETAVQKLRAKYDESYRQREAELAEEFKNRKRSPSYGENTFDPDL
eukprot:scaffold457_cov117-Skeletonema_dohrnii-CCMP3373.AAC.13